MSKNENYKKTIHSIVYVGGKGKRENNTDRIEAKESELGSNVLYNNNNYNKFRIKCSESGLHFDFYFKNSYVIKYTNEKNKFDHPKINFNSDNEYKKFNNTIFINISFTNLDYVYIFDNEKWVFFKIIDDKVQVLVFYKDDIIHLKLKEDFLKIKKNFNEVTDEFTSIYNNYNENILYNLFLISKYYDILKFYSIENKELGINLKKENDKLIPVLNISDEDYINNIDNIDGYIHQYIWQIKNNDDYVKQINNRKLDIKNFEGIIKLIISIEISTINKNSKQTKYLQLESNPIEIINDKNITEESINVNKSFLFSLLMNNKNINYEKIIGLIL